MIAVTPEPGFFTRQQWRVGAMLEDLVVPAQLADVQRLAETLESALSHVLPVPFRGRFCLAPTPNLAKLCQCLAAKRSCHKTGCPVY